MIEVADFYKQLKDKEIEFFTGVPDSLLKDFCAYVTDNTSSENNIIVANEGNAIALAAGYHLATSNIGLVYMQNSGIGNAINPLLSLVDEEVYQIPMLLLIGWRGEPGKKDACQHIKQGAITLDLLETMGIPYSILPEDATESKKLITKAYKQMNSNNTPYAIVVKKGTFTNYSLKNKIENDFELSREEAIEKVLSKLKDDILISTTGKISREVFEVREKFEQGHQKDFLMVGSMGHASQIALAVASNKEDKNIFCLDGDGALIMHLGGLTTIGATKLKNYKHIVFNNGAHDSVGGQPTVGLNIDIEKIAKASGYKNTFQAESRNELEEKLELLIESEGPSLLEVKVKKGARKDLGRPSIGSIERKKLFMNYLK
ncbi:phosphonopyruvate decarboxylase [Natroniella sp. ANB-PHB2]|uniref:phosphonopyruvate decarboxylase n=1 Tax=Natroniella sp. ANB-PHB2 TaxID=3384444 RepID=UPI0038D4CE64